MTLIKVKSRCILLPVSSQEREAEFEESIAKEGAPVVRTLFILYIRDVTGSLSYFIMQLQHMY